MKKFTENTFRQYLLGLLSDAGQIDVEDAVFADADVRARLETAENDLIDEYTRRELNDTEKTQFEKMFLNSPARLEKIQFAVALAELSKKPAVKIVEEKTGLRDALKAIFLSPQFGFAVILIFILGLGAAFLLSRRSEEPQIARQNNQNVNNTGPTNANLVNDYVPTPSLVNENSRTNLNRSISNKFNENRNTTISAPTPARTPLQPAPTFAAIIFPSGLMRDGGNQKFTMDLSKNETQARLIFNLEKGDNLPFYLIKLNTRDGKLITSSKVPRRNLQISLNIPAEKLAAGFYTATISGIAANGTNETIGFFDFEVIKR